MYSYNRKNLSRIVGLGWLAFVVSLTSFPAAAQLAPTGDHYAARPSNTGYAGSVNSQGAFAASVPLVLPPEHRGLPVPVQITYVEHDLGAAGLGWDVPLSFVRDSTTFAGHRPLGAPEVVPQAREQISMTLDGRSLDLVATGTAYVARRDAPEIKVIKQSASVWVAYDGVGRTYTFSNAASQALVGAGLWLLQDVTGPGGSRVHLDYTVTTPNLSGNVGFAIDLSGVSYNPHPTTAGCYKNSVTLTYNADAVSPMSVSMLGGQVLTRLHTLNTVDVSSRSDCGASATLVRTYQLNYLSGGDPDTRLPRLQSVTMVGEQGTPERSTSVPVAAYTYGNATQNGILVYQDSGKLGTTANAVSGVATNSPPVPALPLGGIGYFSSNPLLDFSGDGVPDFGGPTTLPPGAANLPIIFQGSASGRFAEEAHSLTTPRYTSSTTASDDMVWRQAIDVNGDGRLDVIDASEQAHTWVVYLNTPQPTDPTKTTWVRRTFSIDSLAHHLSDAGIAVDPNFLPLSLRHTDRTGAEVTTTLWKLMDINGDGYPDVVFHTTDNRLAAVLNIGGVHLVENPQTPTDNEPFSAPVTLSTNDACGVEQWQSDAATGENQTLVCGLVDVNGDAIVDRVINGAVQLGTGKIGSEGFFTAAMFNLPGPLAAVLNSQKAFCTGSNPTAQFSVNQQAGLLDINGDGIPDYVMQGTDSMWSVYFGTGAGFSPAVLENPNAEAHGIHQFALSSEVDDCAGNLSTTTSGLVDINGDGKPDVFLNGEMYQLVGSGNAAGAPAAGRLIQIDNGYGAITTVTYASAKVNTTTLHQVPFTEIVVTSLQTTAAQGLGGGLNQTLYAYGDAEQIFDPALDRFV